MKVGVEPSELLELTLREDKHANKQTQHGQLERLKSVLAAAEAPFLREPEGERASEGLSLHLRGFILPWSC